MSLVKISTSMSKKVLIIATPIFVLLVAATLLTANVAPNSFLGSARQAIWGNPGGPFATPRDSGGGFGAIMDIERQRAAGQGTSSVGIAPNSPFGGSGSIGNVTISSYDPEVVEVEGDAAADPRDQRNDEEQELTDAEMAAGLGQRTHAGERVLEGLVAGTVVTRVLRTGDHQHTLTVTASASTPGLLKVSFKSTYYGDKDARVTLGADGKYRQTSPKAHLYEEEDGTLVFYIAKGKMENMYFPLSDVR